jgi:hypothetical protein
MTEEIICDCGHSLHMHSLGTTNTMRHGTIPADLLGIHEASFCPCQLTQNEVLIQYFNKKRWPSGVRNEHWPSGVYMDIKSFDNDGITLCFSPDVPADAQVHVVTFEHVPWWQYLKLAVRHLFKKRAGR